MSINTSFAGKDRMNYETPPDGITLTGYIVRRLHKTVLLKYATSLREAKPDEALAYIAIYAAASATSWGEARYQPRFDRPGTVITEDDPETDAAVTVHQLERNPHYAFEYEVNMPDGSTVTGSESILGTTVGLRGLGMPAPSRYVYTSADASYTASAIGTITSELVPGLFSASKIRGYGTLQLEDSEGRSGYLELDRSGHIRVQIDRLDGTRLNLTYNLT